MIRTVFCIIVITIVATGCATSNVSKRYILDDNPGKGLIIGSLSKTKSKTHGHQGLTAAIPYVKLFYRKIGGDVNGHIELHDELIGNNTDFDNDGYTGKMYAIELDPGRYEFYKWTILQGSVTFIYPKKEFSYQFDVVKGKTTYIGEMNLQMIFEKGLFGIGVVTGADIFLKDSYDRDIKIFNDQHENMKHSKVRKTIKRIMRSAEIEANII